MLAKTKWINRSMSSPCLKTSSKGVILSLKVIPNSSKNALVGIENELLKVKIQAPPEKGKANDMLIEFLSKILCHPKKSIILIKGKASNRKVLLIENLNEEIIREILICPLQKLL